MSEDNGGSPLDDIYEKLRLLMDSQAKKWKEHERIWESIVQPQNSTSNLRTAVSETNAQISSLVGAIRQLIDRIPPENLKR